ncbi:MAG TPA: hypothetical protein VFE51_29830 [Verrucomicrobiae bacterium]|nr:hypothetical protein [Verrucomicrobiae bacterium]
MVLDAWEGKGKQDWHAQPHPAIVALSMWNFRPLALQSVELLGQEDERAHSPIA